MKMVFQGTPEPRWLYSSQWHDIFSRSAAWIIEVHTHPRVFSVFCFYTLRVPHPESFHNIGHCTWWKPKLLCNFAIRNTFFNRLVILWWSLAQNGDPLPILTWKNKRLWLMLLFISNPDILTCQQWIYW